MKKTLLVVLTIVMALSMLAVASAETRTYMMSAITDADGNAIATINEDGTAVMDAEGNDITSDWPILVFQCDDEAMTGTWGTEDSAVACALTEEESEDGTMDFTATFEDGTSMSLIYDQESDMFAFTDENGNIYVLINIIAEA